MKFGSFEILDLQLQDDFDRKFHNIHLGHMFLPDSDYQEFEQQIHGF